MDIFEKDSEELTPEQLARIKALECASRITTESIDAGSYASSAITMADRTLSIAGAFYDWIMCG